MSLPETITLDIPNLLTTAGVLVAVLAAIYSARSADAARRQAGAAEAQSRLAQMALAEARRQNQIAGHAHCLDIYKAFLSFRSTLFANGADFKRETIWNLWEHAKVADFYFPEAVAKQLSELVETALEIQDAREEWKDTTHFDDPERAEKNNATHEKMWRLRDELVKDADIAMRQELKITREEGCF